MLRSSQSTNTCVITLPLARIETNSKTPLICTRRATPDPFIDELQILSYASRPRACKDLYKVPRRKDFIEVLWCLDGMPGLPEKWCPAEVLHTSRDPGQDSSKCLAKGVLLYLPGETWNEQIDEVEFCGIIA